MSISPIKFSKLLTVIFQFVVISDWDAPELSVQECVFVMDGSCGGGEDVDPHAVLGTQTETAAFFYWGKWLIVPEWQVAS